MQPLGSPKFFNTRPLFRLFALSLNPIGSAYNFAADAKNLYKNVFCAASTSTDKIVAKTSDHQKRLIIKNMQKHYL